MFIACKPMITNSAEKSMPASGGINRRTGRSSGSHSWSSSAAAGL